jgi:GDP-mannose 6-dehydrogenase
VVHDPDIRLDEMLGSNRDYLERHLPQIATIAVSSVEEAVGAADVVVVTQRRPEFDEAVARLTGTKVVDLVSVESPPAPEEALYSGLSW